MKSKLFEKFKDEFFTQPDLENARWAERYNVSSTTITSWKKKLGVSGKLHNSKDPEPILHLLRTTDLSNEIIAKRTDSSVDTIARYRRLVKREKEREGLLSKEVRIDSIRGRKDEAIKQKAEHLGMSLEEFMNKWIPQPTGKQWLSDMGFV